MKEKQLVNVLLVDIMGSDCTNNGKTSGQLAAYLIHKQGPHQVDLKDLENTEYPVLTIVPGYGDRKYMAIPYGDEDKRPMFGGHFIYCSDSRFTEISDQPIHVHDRYER